MTFHVKHDCAERADHKTEVFHVKRRGTVERVFHVKLAGSVSLDEFGVHDLQGGEEVRARFPNRSHGPQPVGLGLVR